MPPASVRALLIALAVPVGLCQGQGPADDYLSRYTQLRALAVDRTQMATVSDLHLDRDVAHLHLAQGTLTLLTPVGGRVIAALFHGRGSFAFSPPNRIEKERLIRFEGRDSLADEFTDLVFLFTDTTLAELRAKAAFADGPSVVAAQANIKSALGYLGDDTHKSFDPDLMADLLNGTQGGQFIAYINRERRGSLLFELDPAATEAVRLYGTKLHGFYNGDAEVITQFAAHDFSAQGDEDVERVKRVEVKHYGMDVHLPQNGGGGLSFAATAHLDLLPHRWGGPWAPFYLFDRATIDSARSASGASLPFFKGKDDNLVWVRLAATPPADTLTSITLYYHGDLVRRFGDFFYLDASVLWYPVSQEYRALATFDLTFHTPNWLQLASIGTRTDSSDAGRMTTTRWVMSQPIRNASFNLGKFQAFRGEDPGVAKVTVLAAEDAHRSVEGLGGHQKNMKEKVGNDVTSAVHFFNRVYGRPPFDEFIATETPLPEGEAFPGLIDLSWATFQNTDNFGSDMIFRAHEVAHQWWGVGVDYASYHDRWLSEGFSDFSGLWYLQSALKDTTRYYEILDRWRSDIMLHRYDRSPISLGHRARSSKDEYGYQTLVYRKGAWVLHMVRSLLFEDDSLGDDRFIGMMRQFFADHVGRRASTRDFQAAVERAWGGPMNWFFDEWVDGSRVPTYRVAYQTRPVDSAWQVTVRVRQSEVADDFLMYVPVAVTLEDGSSRRFRIKVTGPETVVDLPALAARPKSVRFNDLDAVLADVKVVSW